MIDTLIHNAHIATMQGSEYGVIEHAAIAIKNGMIEWIGSKINIPNEISSNVKTVIDAKEQWITPPLVDCHTHLVYAGNRAAEFEKRLTGVSYAEIAEQGGGILSTVRATREASEQELFDLAVPRVQALINQGVTHLEIKSGYGLDIESELKMLRVAIKLGEELDVEVYPTLLAAHAIPPEFKRDPDAYVEYICDEIIPAVSIENLAVAVDVFCEFIGFSFEQTKKIFECSKEHSLRIKCHAEQLTDSSGAGLAAEFKALSADHLEFASEKSIQKMAENKTVAVLLPGAFYYLKEKKLPPIDLLRKYNVPIAIATDSNPGSSPTTSLLLMLNMACTLLGLTPVEAWRGVTVNAAKALGITSNYGLEVGKDAKFCLWSVDHPRDLVYQFGNYPSPAIWRA